MISAPNQKLLWATFISSLGSSLSLMAVPWVIYKTTGELFLVSVFFVTAQVLSIGMLPWFGDLLDRVERKAVATWVQLAAFSFQLAAAVTWVAFGRPDILALIAALSLCMTSLDRVARMSLAHAYANEQGYRELNKWFEIVRQAVTFSAGLAGAAIFGVAGLIWVLLLDCASSLVGAFLIHRLPAPSVARIADGAPGKKRDRWADALNIIRRRRVLVPMLLISVVPTSTAVAMNTIYPKHFSDFLQASSAAYYGIDIFYALGAVVLTLLSSRISHKLSVKSWIACSLACGMLASILIGAVPLLAATYICIFTFGALSAFIRIARSNLVMEMLDADEQGRANSFIELAGTMITMALIGIAGAVADLHGLQGGWAVFVVINAIALLAFLPQLLNVVSFRRSGSAGPRRTEPK